MGGRRLFLAPGWAMCSHWSQSSTTPHRRKEVLFGNPLQDRIRHPLPPVLLGACMHQGRWAGLSAQVPAQRFNDLGLECDCPASRTGVQAPCITGRGTLMVPSEGREHPGTDPRGRPWLKIKKGQRVLCRQISDPLMKCWRLDGITSMRWPRSLRSPVETRNRRRIVARVGASRLAVDADAMPHAYVACSQ